MLNSNDHDHLFRLAELLGKTLVLCPSFGSLEGHTEMCLEWLCGFGAKKLRSSSCPDIALHRSLLATRAYNDLHEEHADRGYVLWLDSDVSIEAPELIMLFEDLLDVYAQQQMGTCWAVSPSVTARYACKSYGNIDAMYMPDKPYATTRETELHPEGEELQPVVSGLGCLLSMRSTFVQHLDHLTPRRFESASEPLRIVSTCNPVDMGKVWRWHGDGMSYCYDEWTMGGGVYLSRARATRSKTILVKPKVNVWVDVPEKQEDSHDDPSTPRTPDGVPTKPSIPVLGRIVELGPKESEETSD